MSARAAGALCGVCADAPHRYRCPTCGLRTCSAHCFGAHKPACAPHAVVPADAAPPGASTAGNAQSAEPEEDIAGVARLDDAALARLRGSPAVVGALRDRPAALDAARRGPDGDAFVGFLDELLLAVGAAHREGGGAGGGVVFDG
jgi:hypothetical protein